MDYSVSLSGWGRFFNVPCSVVDDYIKLASSQQLKVLLYILCNGQKFTTEIISKETGVLPADVDDSIVFWCQNNVLKIQSIEQSNDEEKNTIPAIKSTIEINASENDKIISTVLSSETVSPVSNKVLTTSHLTPKQLDEIISSQPDLKELMLQSQEVLGRELTYYDSKNIVELFSDYGFPATSIILILEFCRTKGKTDSGIAYTKKLAKDWLEKDILSPGDVESEIIRQTELMKIENRLAKLMQIEGRFSTKQKAVIREWVEKNYSIELIMCAYDRCLDNIFKVEFNYINKILSSWKEKGITTVEAAEKEELPSFKNRKQAKNTVDEGKEHSYDLNEIEQFALMNTPKLKTKKE